MTKDNTIPSHVLEMWEREAIDQKIPYTEFGSFLKMKQEQYWQKSEPKNIQEPIFANAARNKLTEYGQRVALETILSIPMVERVIKFARFDLEDLKDELSHGFNSEQQKLNFIERRDNWFMRLKTKMKDLRLSKEVLAANGLNFNDCKQFAFQVI